MAQEHRSQVVRPSLSTGSSIRKGGLGGGGTKRPFQRPFSLSSNGKGELRVPSMTTVVAKFELTSGGNVSDNSLNGKNRGGVDGGVDNEVTEAKGKVEDKAVALFRSVRLVVFR